MSEVHPDRIEAPLKSIEGAQVERVDISTPDEGDWAVLYLSDGRTLYVDAPTLYEDTPDVGA